MGDPEGHLRVNEESSNYHSLFLDFTSVKISNNALNFLLAQYRAIFKRAYVKGIASAVLLTAGLAMGQAQAAAENTYVDSVDDLPTTAGQEVTITGKQYDSSTTPAPESEYTYIQIITSGEKTNFDGTLNIASGSKYNYIYGVSGDVTISGKGTLNIDVTETDITQPSLSITGSGGDVSFDINAVNVNRGKLVLNDTTGTASGSIDIAADSINIGTEGETAELSISATSTDQKVTLGRPADNTAANKVTGSTITVGATGKLSLATGTGSGAEIVGDLLAITEGGLMITTAGSTGSVKTENFTVDAGSFKVISGSAVSESFVGQNANIHGHFLVDEGTSWVINNTDAKDADNEDYVPSVTFESGADIQLGGTLSISGSTLTVAEGANLVATTGADSHTSGTIVVTKDSDDNAGTLKISSTDLKRFLTAKNGDADVTYSAIVAGTGDDDGKFVVDTDNDPTKAAQGSVLLSGTGILELTDTNQIDLATAFTFSGGGSNGKAGNIVINEGTVKGHNLQVSKAIANVAASNKLTVEADILTIGGSSTSNTETKLSQFNISGAIAHNEVNLEANDGNGTFTIDQTLTLSGDYYEKDANGDYITSQVKAPGQINGDKIVLSGSSAKAPLTINGGAWENAGQSLTIQSGTLTVGAVSGDTTQADGEDTNGTWKYTKNGNPASLTWHGDFIFDGDSQASDAEVKVTGASGADATLDLTDADITWGSGSITLSGALASGEDDPVRVSPTDYFARASQGILKLDGDQVSEYLGHGLQTVATTLTIDDGGLLLVNGSIINDIDVDDFEVNGSATPGDINISGGKMFVTGSLSLVDGVGADGKDDATANGLTIDGILGADTISYTNKSTSIDEDDPSTDVATVSGGTLAVASSFTSKNHEVKFVSGAGLLLDSKGFLQEWAPETAGEGGTVSVDHLTFTGKDSGTTDSKLDVQTGAWIIGSADNLGDVDILEGAELNVGPESAEFIRTGFGASLTLDNLTVTSGASSNSGSVTVQDGSKLTVNTIQIDAGSELTVGDGATVTITGNYAHNLSGGKLVDGVPEGLTDLGATNVDKQAGINLEGADITLNSGKLVIGDTAARKLVTLDASAAENKQVTISDALKANYTLTGTSELRLDFTAAEGDDPSDGLTGVNGGARLTAAQAKALKEGLFGATYTDSDFAVGSYINVGDLALGMEYDPDSMTADWTKIEDFVQIESDVTNDTVMQLLVTKVDEGKNDLSGQFGAIEASSTTPATVAGSLGLHKAYAADGATEKFFASTVQNGNRVAAGLKVDTDSTLALYGEGTIGTITGQGVDSETTVYFNEGDFQAGTTVVKPINSNDTAIANIGRMVVNNNVIVEGDAQVGAMTVSQSLTAQNLTLGNTNGDDSTVFGTVDVAETLSVENGSTLQVADGSITTKTLELQGSTLMVGFDAQDKDNPNTDIKEDQSYTGQVFASTVDLRNGGGIVVDPALDQNTAIVGFTQFHGGNRTETSFDLGETGGNLFVGQNSAIGAGFETLEDLTAFIEPQQINGSLSGKYKAIAAIDGLLTLTDGTGLTMTAQSYQDFVDYIREGSGSHWNNNASYTFNQAHGTIEDTVYFGADSALKLSAEAVKEAQVGKGTQAVITIDSTGGQLIANGGEIIISGDLRANSRTQYQLFADKGTTASEANGSGVAVVDINGDAVADDKGILVTTENGFLYGMVNNTNGGTISLSVDKAHAYSIMSGASDPVVQTLIAYAQGYNSEIRDEQGNVTGYDDLYYGYTDGPNDPTTGQPTQVKNTEAYSNDFLAASIEQGNGAAAEAAARLAVYGGAPQAAIKAGQSSTDAIAARFGIGSAISNLTEAGNTQGAALWLAPVYKTSDSDGFDAQGVDYGVNVDLYGVALGADYARLMVRVLPAPPPTTLTTTALVLTQATP